jgi:hypothetical protein
MATVRHAPTAREIDRAALGGLDVHSVGLGIEDAAVALAALQTRENPS